MYVIAHEKENILNADTLVVMASSNPLGVKNINNQLIDIYPNPAGSSITVKLPESVNGGILEIYDVLGNKVITKEIGVSEVQVDISTLPQGQYILRFVEKDGTAYTKRFQKI